MQHFLQKNSILFIILLNSLGLFAQKKPDFKEQGFGKSGRDAIKCIIQNKKGEYVLVGSSGNWFLNNDADIFFTKINANTFTPLINAIPIGDKHTDGANSVVETRDGGYVIAGYTDSAKLGKREAWLVKVSETGLRLWDTKVSTPQDDEFTAVTEAPNGDLWLTGASNDKLWVVKTDAQGKNEKRFTSYSPANVARSWGNALTWLQNGRYLMIVGTQIMKYPQNEPNLLLVRFDTEGEDFLDERSFAKAEGNAIARDKTGHFGVIGTSFSRDKGDIFFMYADEKGDTSAQQRFGKIGVEEHGLGIAEDWDGNFIVSGEFYEESRKNFTEGWLHKIQKDGNAVWEKPRAFGGTGNDAFYSVLSSARSSILATGKRYKGVSSDGWLVEIEPKTPLQNRGKIDVNIIAGRFHDDEDSTLLRRNKRGFYEFWLENRDTSDIFGLTARINQTKNKHTATNSFYNRLVIGTLRGGERRLITVPFQGDANLKRDEWDFDIKFLALKDTLDIRHSFHVSTRDELNYKLEPTHNFPTDIHAGQVVTFNFSLTNTGDLAAKNVQLRADVRSGVRIKLQGNDRINLEDIAVGETKTGTFTFEVEKEFIAEVLLLPVYVIVNGVRLGVENQLVARLHPDTTTKIINREIKDPLRLIWQNGKETATVTKPNCTLQLIVETDKTLTRKDNFKVFYNGREHTGEKFDNVKLVETKSAGLYQHRFLLLIDASLPIGKMTVKVVVNDGNAPKQTEFTVNRVNAPNLYVLSVGVDYSSNKHGISPLSYTRADAVSIDSILLTQKGKNKLFNDVITISLTNTFQTKGKYIKQQLIQLAETCTENDVFMVFLSGHGGIPNAESKTIHFLGSDYDPSVSDTYLDYETDIKAILDKAKGQKLLFLDACQKKMDKSASVDPQQLSDAIERVIQATKTFRALLSCSKEQASWETDIYGHGAFTQAILEAFRNQTVPCGDNEEDCNANTDPNDVEATNRFLTFQELARFVKKRVPTIVKIMGRAQNPTERDEHPEEDIPIFWFDK